MAVVAGITLFNFSASTVYADETFAPTEEYTTAFRMLDGSSIKLDEDGFAFRAIIDKATYNSLGENQSVYFMIIPESFKNAFSGIWWAVSTLLTVGYGDIYPVTPAGRVVGIILAFLGVGIVAIPTGILSAGFVQQYTRIKDIEGTIEESPIDHIVIAVNKNHMWCGCGINDIKIPDGMMILALVRGGEVIKGDAVVCEGDRLLIGSRLGSLEGMAVGAITIREKSEWTDKSVYHLEDELSVVCTGILRGEETIIPDKDTVVKTGDELIILARGRASKAGGRNNEIMG